MGEKNDIKDDSDSESGQFTPVRQIIIILKTTSPHLNTHARTQTLPGRVPPAFRAQGADMVSVQQESGGGGTSEQRQQADVALGGQESGETAGHGGYREEGQVARTR